MDPAPSIPTVHESAYDWINANWHAGVKIAGSDSNYVAFHAFCAGAAFAYGDAASMFVPDGNPDIVLNRIIKSAAITKRQAL